MFGRPPARVCPQPAVNPKDAPPSVKWPEGWQIQPDIVVQGSTYHVPAHPKNNVIEWVSITVPTNFQQDTWVTSVQIRPEHPKVTHHMCLGFNRHDPDVEYFKPYWDEKPRDDEG